MSKPLLPDESPGDLDDIAGLQQITSECADPFEAVPHNYGAPRCFGVCKVSYTQSEIAKHKEAYSWSDISSVEWRLTVFIFKSANMTVI